MEFTNGKAFDYEEGQFICHLYKSIPRAEEENLDEVICIIEAKQEESSEAAFVGWTAVDDGADDGTDDETSLHMTLLRGHRAIYYHQIKPLIETLKTECATLRPINIFLDKLTIYQNFEKSKQFLCLSARPLLNENPYFTEAKLKIQNIVDQYAIKLTEEDETSDTLGHCSLMYRESNEDINLSLSRIEELCHQRLDDYPTCLIHLDEINVRIGNHTYSIPLGG